MQLKLTKGHKETARALRGKTIARVILYPFDPNREGSHTIKEIATDPVIVFTDGARLSFVVEETEGPEYGIHLSLQRGVRPRLSRP
jgi:hypothetical protein